jgi:hypothetical protein
MNKTIYNIGSIAMLGLPQSIGYISKVWNKMGEIDTYLITQKEHNTYSKYLITEFIFGAAVITGQVGVIYKTLDWLLK